MESTMIHNEMLDELADFLGLREKIAGITARAMNGEIDFAGALEERVGLLKGLAVGRLDEAATRIRYMPGGATLIATMQKHGAYCALVSGGFTYFTAMVRRTLGFDLDAANVLEHDGKTLAGTVEPHPRQGGEARRPAAAGRRTRPWRRGRHHVGDGANDLPMLQAAGLGVAFHAKPTVAAQVPARIGHGDLTALLYLQGYRRSDFEEERSMTEIQQIVLAKRPEGDVTADCFRAETVSLPALGEGQILIAQRFLSLDPYMRPRMTELRSYTPPFELDKPLTGGSVGEVVETKNPRFAKGDIVMGMLNWATHTVHDGKGLRKIDADGLPLSAHLGVLGMPSFTAWYGIKHICKPKAGETVFVSAATGAVGQVAGQLAKLAGARVVGCAGDEQKCQWAVREAGYDACFNHKTERDSARCSTSSAPGHRCRLRECRRQDLPRRVRADEQFRPHRLLRRHLGIPGPGRSPAREDVHHRAAPPHPAGLHRLRPCRPDGRFRERGRRPAGLRQAEEPRDRDRRPGQRPAGLHGPAQGREFRQAGREGLTLSS